MTKIIAAIDNSPAARPVLSMALALSLVLDANVEAVHVSDDDGETASGMAESFGVNCRLLPGDPYTAISQHSAGDDVVALVVGARRRLQTAQLGHLAQQIADTLDKPILVVPPEAKMVGRLHTVVIAMEAAPAKARSLTTVVNLAAGADLDLVIVHVDDEESIPSFSDQVAHETQAYADEFLARYLPGAPRARLELRVGPPADEIINLTNSISADLLAVGWPRDRGPERGTVAKEVLNRSHVPVLLVALR